MPLYSEMRCSSLVCKHGLAILDSVYHSLLIPIIIHLLCIGMLALFSAYLPILAMLYHICTMCYPCPVLKICHHTIPWSQHQPLVTMVTYSRETFKVENFRKFWAEVFSAKFGSVAFLMQQKRAIRENCIFHQFAKVFSLKSFLLYGMFLALLTVVFGCLTMGRSANKACSSTRPSDYSFIPQHSS